MGRDEANPLAAILCVAMLLDHGPARPAEAARVRDAVDSVLDAGYRTADIARGRSDRVIGTREAGAVVREALV